MRDQPSNFAIHDEAADYFHFSCSVHKNGGRLYG